MPKMSQSLLWMMMMMVMMISLSVFHPGRVFLQLKISSLFLVGTPRSFPSQTQALGTGGVPSRPACPLQRSLAQLLVVCRELPGF